MSQSNPYYALLSRLQGVTATAAGDPVVLLTVEPGPDEPPRLIRGFLVAAGANGPRHEPCSWLPTGRHRLSPKLNLTIPEA